MACCRYRLDISLLFLVALAGWISPRAALSTTVAEVVGAVPAVSARLIAMFGEEHRARIESGVARVASLWREGDGNEEEMTRFCEQNFVADPEKLDACFDRLEHVYEILWGHLHQIDRTLREPIDLDMGEPLPVDDLLTRYSPYAHVDEDFFTSRIAFFVVLNFPRFSLTEKSLLGPSWSRRQWAMARMGDMYAGRIPAEVSVKINDTTVDAQRYVYNYYIHADRLLSAREQAVFPDGLRLLEHWGVRDEMRGRYTDPDGLIKQEMLYRVMLRIVDQTIPAQVIGKRDVFWEPESNRLFMADAMGFTSLEAAPAADSRYDLLLRIFRSRELLDAYYPDNPNVLDRAFDLGREISAAQYEDLIVTALSAPQAKRLFMLIRQRLGRDLRPFDIWYNGFKLAGSWDEAELDRTVRKRYPTAVAFQEDLPAILNSYGFSLQTAQFLADRIVVEDSRGSGHAMPASMRSDKVHLRTRVEPDGMDYKSYNIALHEMGHNLEQIFSLHAIDHYFLRGVPNNGFTEALAIMCQNRDLQILGVAEPGPQAADYQTLDTYLSTLEIGAVGLIEARIWRWLYAHPDAAAADLREAVLTIAKGIWNEYFTPLVGVADSPILAIYAHMLSDPTYLPNYSLGHVILFQLEHFLRGKDFAREVERFYTLGNLTPDQWLREAVGEPLSVEPLLAEAERILDRVLE